MPNIATVLKAEIARLAKKEARSAADPLKRAVTQHRSDLAKLKRQVADLERELKRLRKAPGRPAAEGQPAEAEGGPIRFSAKGLAAQRKRLGLSAADCGLLLNASGQSVYNWESGSARPRAKHLAAIAAMRKLGKRQVNEILESLRPRG